MIREAREQDKCRVIVVNDNWRRIPNADVLYAADVKWWNHYVNEVRASGFAGELWTICPDAARIHDLCFIKGRGGKGLSKNPHLLHTHSNGGAQALGLAYHFGGEPILLVGYDMQHTDGKAHWFGKHPEGWGNADGCGEWVTGYDEIQADLKAEGIPIFNCSIETAIRTIPRAPLDIFL